MTVDLLAASMTEMVEDVTEKVGEVGIGLLIALENIVPPIPSEAILPFAGFQASRGLMNPIWAWVAATIGAVVGAWVLYLAGALLGYDRVYELAGKRWFFLLSRSDLERGRTFFDRHGGPVVLFGRCIPLVRSAVSVPAGLDRMPMARFTLFTAIGSGVWNALFITLGWNLGARWEQVEGWVSPISKVVLVVVVLGILVLIARKVRAVRRQDAVTSRSA